MSDRRRYPPKDDWDDDLGLSGFDQPASTSRSTGRSGSESRPGEPNDLDDDFLSPAPRARSTSGGTQVPNPSYDSSGERYNDPYPATSQRSPRGTRPPTRDAYSSSGGNPDPASADPYTATQPPTGRPASRSYQPDVRYDDPYTASAYESEFAEAAYPETAPSRRQPRSRDSRNRPAVSVPRPAIDDGAVIAIIAASLLSIVFMVATIAAGSGDLPDWFPIHLDAAGNADLWGNTSTLWRIPFGAFMALIMALVIAAGLWKRDRFAAKFAVAGTAAIQLLAWVALIDFIW